MLIVSIVISCLALALSAFTFYWTTLRNRRAFFLIRLANLPSVEPSQFALVNGGKHDLLITSLACFFENKDKNGGFYPAQRIHFAESEDMLLQAGKAFHCKVEFVEDFTSNFALAGEQDANFGNLYCHPMKVEIQWVEMDGSMHKKSVLHSRFWFNPSGKVMMCGPLGTKYDLYEI